MMKMLSDDEARKLFQVARVGRLGCIVNTEPYVVPINFAQSFVVHETGAVILDARIRVATVEPRPLVGVRR